MRRAVSKSLGAVLVMALLFGMAHAALAETKQINVNTATAEELMSLKGVGKTKSQAIIDHREKNGPFKSVDDLKAVPGIGDKLLEQLRPEITVGAAPSGGTTAKR
jgi:competence protein ComEA